MTCRQRGFTLIELLVVIAIIAILAAILFPVFAKAREKARQSSCQSNLKQMGLAILQYTQDYDEQYPKAWMGAANGGSIAGVQWKWMDSVSPYCKSTQIFDCPSASGAARYSVANGTNYGSYVINSSYWSGVDGHSPSGTWSGLAMAAAPATTIWVTDGNGAATFETAWQNKAANPVVGTYNNLPALANTVARHMEMANCLFCDGHVKSQKMGELAKVNANTVMYLFTLEDD
ncbi:MAG: DUF1559 domain-containing protein [Armatimonadetes bacterium]|nr:DUF1559 domain-containing protein [Armatimonadota bacterium]